MYVCMHVHAQDDVILTATNLEVTKKEMRRFNAKRKFKAGVRSVGR